MVTVLPHFPWESRIQEFSSIRKFYNPVLLVDFVMTGKSPVVKMLAVSKLLPMVLVSFTGGVHTHCTGQCMWTPQTM